MGERLNGSRHVFFVAYGGGHVTMVVPVMRELQQRGVRCTLLALTTGHAKAIEMGVQPKGYRDFRHLVPDLDEVLSWGEQLAAENSHPAVDPMETQLYLGVNYAEWVHQHGPAEAVRMYRESGRLGFVPRTFMKRVLQEVMPDAVVTTNTPRTEQAAIEAAVALGIPSLAMIDLFALPYDTFLRRPVHADRIAVISKAAKLNVIAAGIPAERIVVTGNPAFDSLAAPGMLRLADEFKARMGWVGRKVVLLAGQLELLPGTPEHFRGPGLVIEVEKRLRAWVAAGDDRALIVRYHPNEFQSFPDLGPQPRVHQSHPVREDLHPVLLAADLVVVQTSTVGLEAVISGRKLLSLAFSPAVTPERWDYGALGLAVSVPAVEDLTRLLEDSLLKPAAPLGDFQVGAAARNVADEVLRLVDERSGSLEGGCRIMDEVDKTQSST